MSQSNDPRRNLLLDNYIAARNRAGKSLYRLSSVHLAAAAADDDKEGVAR